MLAGRPFRISPATDLDDAVWFTGFVKLRLGHGRRGTLIVPDQIFVRAGPWRFLQPSFFSPCLIGFNVEAGLHVAEFTADVGSPRSTRLARLRVRFRSNARVRSYPDGSQLYKCEIQGPKLLAHYAAGRCRQIDSGDFILELFHHTNAGAYTSICASRELWASTWNLQGTRRLANVAYVYLTSLPKIVHPEDLNRIAMASSGKIAFQTTSHRPTERMLELAVYRESTTGRTSVVKVGVPSSLLAPPHLLLHPQVFGSSAYYEAVGPEIFRIGVKPGTKMPIPHGLASPAASDLKTFEYIVLGDASELEGLAAPYAEEETEHVMHLELIDGESDLFAFWLNNANSDQITGRTFEARRLEPSGD